MSNPLGKLAALPVRFAFTSLSVREVRLRGNALILPVRLPAVKEDIFNVVNPAYLGFKLSSMHLIAPLTETILKDVSDVASE